MELWKGQKGFTLAEMMVAVAISGIVLAGVYTAFVAQRQSYDAQEQVTDVQQNTRVAMYMMTREIRLAGYDPTFSRLFGITGIGFRDIDDNPDLTVNGISAISFTIDRDPNDLDGDGETDEANGVFENNDTINYSIYDSGDDGTLDLGRRIGVVGVAGGGGRQLVAENIIALGFAYAYDADDNNSLDTYLTTGGANAVIWAIDANNDGNLDSNIDADGDGDIDADDGPGLGGNGVIAGTAIIPVVNMDKIRAVKIWLLARSSRQDAGGFVDTGTYTVGRQVITPNTNFRHRLLQSTVYCRNLGLD